MPNPSQSTDFLDVNSPTYPESLHRSRSGGYADHLAEKEIWERRSRERDMKRYHTTSQSRLSPTSSTASPLYQPRSSFDRLYVPTFDDGHRRVRSHDQIVEKRADDEERGYRVREERPRPSELPVRRRSKSKSKRSESHSHKTRPSRPSIKVQIHQDDAPRPRSMSSSGRGRSATTSRRGQDASPPSPSSQPQLLVLSATLQNRFSEIGEICQPNLHIEAADPRDLTFAKIVEEVEGFAFQFKIWSQIVNLDNMEMIEARKRNIVELAATTMNRMLKSVEELGDVCARAAPRDLKMTEGTGSDDEELYESSEEDGLEGGVENVMESLGFVIRYHLNSINLQMQILSRLTRSLQEATPNAKAEVIALSDLVVEVDRFFGSTETLEKFSIDRRLSGRDALDEARYAFGRIR
ncbi:hypothetical protein K504DRAFT_399912 [Pleomassaria siparia CBS 279.74]|uniref:Uncharacterized protein n=1 Tax=Pleomassaria siparia CBS 279.74 TaxID=1314801 RepID=A0A6G1KMK6_9PLEO|nr:hypothetical protein K504DRAFT_399912 [Pleomassaria siparia CBS 279.74]